MEAAEVAAWAAASAAKDAAEALAKDAAAAVATAKDAAAAVATAKEAAAAAKEAAVAGSAAELNANEAAVAASAVKASAAVLDAKEAASVAGTLEEAAVAVTAAVQASKKRKLNLIDDDQDLISRLPDVVLGSIVSLLPTREGARTQAISRRWGPIWRSAALNLVVDGQFKSKGLSVVDLILKILSEHPGPACRFLLRLFHVVCSDKIIEGWLGSHALDNLQELELTYSWSWVNREMYLLLPSSVFRFAPTLRVAKFDNCHFPDLIVQLALKFPSLKQLTLCRVTILEDVLHTMLSGCTALESLELQDNLGTARLCIASQTLKSLGFCAESRFPRGILLQELVIEDAPCLERLLPLDPKNGPVTIRIISAPKLKILGMLSDDIPELHFGTTVFQKMIAVHLTTKLHTVRVLLLDSTGPNLDAVVNFLKCFPCLGRLYVIFHSRNRMNNVRKYDPIECLELHLTQVMFMNYDGAKSPSIDFINFFILNAKVLKEMRIRLAYHRMQKWFVTHHELLQINYRASQDARIELKCGTTFFPRNKRTHDFSMADPFYMPYKCRQCL